MRITAELPGLDEKDVSLEIANGVLSISGEKKTESEDRARRFSERYYGRFERRIPLQGVEEDKATAAFKNGVLTVSVPKSAEAKNVRRIAINLPPVSRSRRSRGSRTSGLRCCRRGWHRGCARPPPTELSAPASNRAEPGAPSSLKLRPSSLLMPLSSPRKNGQLPP